MFYRRSCKNSVILKAIFGIECPKMRLLTKWERKIRFNRDEEAKGGKFVETLRDENFVAFTAS